MPSVIVIVEEDRARAKLLTDGLTAVGDVELVRSGAAAIDFVARTVPGCVVIGTRVPDMAPLACLDAIRARHPALPVVVLVEAGGEVDAVEALQHGATDYVLGYEGYLTHLAATVRAALERVGTTRPGDDGHVVAESPAMAAVLRLVDEAVRERRPVLIEGESGTGKGHIARAIHRRSARGRGPFFALNCASAPEDVVEFELAGRSMAGLPSRRDEPRPGLFEVADGGTLFLDEVSHLPPAAQARLMCVLERGETCRLGDTKLRRGDVRVIAATRSPLDVEVARQLFRADLLHRLSRLHIRLPPLRERREDIVPLALHFLARCARAGRLVGSTFDPGALQLLVRYDWPGNVRELAMEIERAGILVEPGDPIRASVLSPQIATLGLASPSFRELVKELDLTRLGEALRTRPRRRVVTARHVTFDPRAHEGEISADGLSARCRHEMTFALVRATQRYAAGRWYVELTLRLPGGQWRAGAWTDVGIVARAPGRIVGYGARGRLGDEIADGDVLGLALDLDRGRLYVRRNGTWVDGAPDDAGAGISIRRRYGPYAVAVAITRRPGSEDSDSWTANFGASAFTHPIPAGYVSYDGRQRAD